VNPVYRIGMGGKHRSKEQQALRLLLRAVREEHELTQETLAAHLGKPQSYVSKYESGERRLDLPEIREVCEAVGLSLPQFVRRYEKALS